MFEGSHSSKSDGSEKILGILFMSTDRSLVSYSAGRVCCWQWLGKSTHWKWSLDLEDVVKVKEVSGDCLLVLAGVQIRVYSSEGTLLNTVSLPNPVAEVFVN